MSEAAVPVLRLTDQGAELIARSVTGEKLYITRLAMGDGQLSNVGIIPSLTAQIHERVSVPATKVTRKGNKLTVFGEVTLAADADSFRWRELSLHGRIGAEAEVLMGYLYNGEKGEMVSPADGVERGIYITLEIDPAADVEVVLGPRETLEWAQITGKPDAFPPEDHSHAWGGIADKPTVFPPTDHSHTWGSIADKPTVFPPTDHSHTWGSIADKPTGFPPASHSHAWSTITGKPSAFPPTAHTHGLKVVKLSEQTLTIAYQSSAYTKNFDMTGGTLGAEALDDYDMVGLRVTGIMAAGTYAYLAVGHQVVSSGTPKCYDYASNSSGEAARTISIFKLCRKANLGSWSVPYTKHDDGLAFALVNNPLIISTTPVYFIQDCPATLTATVYGIKFETPTV